MTNYQYYNHGNYNQERCGLLLPFLAGAVVAAPIAYLAGNNNKPEYVFPSQYPQQYQQPVYFPPYYPQYYPYPQISQNYYSQINQNPL